MAASMHAASAAIPIDLGNSPTADQFVKAAPERHRAGISFQNAGKAGRLHPISGHPFETKDQHIGDDARCVARAIAIYIPENEEIPSVFLILCSYFCIFVVGIVRRRMG